MAYTTTVQVALFCELERHGIDPDEFIEVLQMYLLMEEWFHSTNLITEVCAARPLIASVIEMIQQVFPRAEGNGWSLPKNHGLSKMQWFMCKYGSGINYYGGPVECDHKELFKKPIRNGNKQIGTMASQTAKRMYETYLFNNVMETVKLRERMRYRSRNSSKSQLDIKLTGEYIVVVHGRLILQGHSCRWTWPSKQRKTPFHVDKVAIKAICQFIYDQDWHSGFEVKGYTYCKMVVDGSPENFHFDREYHGKEE